MYGIPFDIMTPDVFGEKFGGGRVPAGTRGFTWSDWAMWVAPDGDNPTITEIPIENSPTPTEAEILREEQMRQVKAGLFTLLIAGAMVGVVIAYDRWKESKRHHVEFKKSRYEEDD